jgi:O-acetyl-ADP-ribose deacetylase (regulator of RNase III)
VRDGRIPTLQSNQREYKGIKPGVQGLESPADDLLGDIMKTVNGNLIDMAFEGAFDVIVHGCNCFCTMKRGIAKEITERCPEAEKVDKITVTGDRSKLGKITAANIGDKFTVVNAYTQYHWARQSGEVAVQYDAVRSCFKNIKNLCNGKRIGYPKIGAGLAGGDWDRISEIIEEELQGEDHTLVIFEESKELPKLKHTVDTTISVDSRDLENFIQEVYGRSIEIVADQEIGNHTLSWHAHTSPGEQLNDFEEKELNEWVSTGKGTHRLGVIMEDLCNRHLIPTGTYLIDTAW